MQKKQDFFLISRGLANKRLGELSFFYTDKKHVKRKVINIFDISSLVVSRHMIQWKQEKKIEVERTKKVFICIKHKKFLKKNEENCWFEAIAEKDIQNASLNPTYLKNLVNNWSIWNISTRTMLKGKSLHLAF